MKKAPKPRNPAAHLRSAGALRQRVVPNKKKPSVRGAKHKRTERL